MFAQNPNQYDTNNKEDFVILVSKGDWPNNVVRTETGTPQNPTMIIGYDANGYEVMNTYPEKSNRKYSILERDSQGNILAQSWYNEDKSFDEVNIITNNAKGDWIEQKSYRSDARCYGWFSQEIEYNPNGTYKKILDFHYGELAFTRYFDEDGNFVSSTSHNGSR